MGLDDLQQIRSTKPRKCSNMYILGTIYRPWMYYFDDDTLYIDHLHLCCIRILDAQNIKGLFFGTISTAFSSKSERLCQANLQ